ncbi:MAG: 5'-nucleotidase [Calditrichia bacterium]
MNSGKLTRLKFYLRSTLIPFLLALLLWQCAGPSRTKPSGFTHKITNYNIRIDSTLTSDSAMNALVAPYRAELDQIMGKVVGHAAVDLRAQKPEGELNNFVADLMVKRANAEYPDTVEMGLTNVGGLRVNIPRGPIALGKIFEVMPFENELVVLALTGEQLFVLAQQIGEVRGECVSGMTLEFKDQKLSRLMVQGEYVDKEKIYHLVTTDYLSEPSRNRLSILGQVPRTFLGVTLRDAIIDEVEALEAAGQPVSARIEGRIVFK